MLSTPVTSPIKASTPNAPVKEKAVKEKAVKEKAVKETAVKEKAVKEKAVKEKSVKEKSVKEKSVKEKAVKEKAVKEKSVKDTPTAVMTTEEENVKEPTSTTRASSGLPAKYGKFIKYSYYLIREINNKSLAETGAVIFDEDAFITAAHIFDETPVQQEFVTRFLENKNITKDMRAHVVSKKKAEAAAIKAANDADKKAKKDAERLAKAEAKKAAKPPKSAKATDGNATNAKTKSKATKVASDDTDLVTSLVTLANAGPYVDAKEYEDEEELDVKVFKIENKEYLIDEMNNLYDLSTHAMVGTWDNVRNIIIAI